MPNPETPTGPLSDSEREEMLEAITGLRHMLRVIVLRSGGRVELTRTETNDSWPGILEIITIPQEERIVVQAYRTRRTKEVNRAES